MRIVDLRRHDGDGRARLEARLVFEAGEAWTAAAPRTLYLEVPVALGEALRLSADPFLLAAFVPAMAAGAERLLVEGPLCPVLRRGVEGAARILGAWSPGWRMPALEVEGDLAAPRGPAVARTGSTLAGGVDSLATLRQNRLAVATDHPASIRDVVFVFGFNSFDFEAGEPVPARERDFAARLARWQDLAREAEVEILPVVTNMRTLAPSFHVWARRTHGAGLAAVAHALGGRLTRFLVPSAGRVDPLVEDGTHPALDPLYSGAALQVVHDGLGQSRLDKLRLLVDWEPAMRVLQPCQQVELVEDGLNCGNCNKCRRTMLALEALGRLEGSDLFPRDRIDEDWVATMRIAQAFDFDYLAELLPALEAGGRGDLVRAIGRRRRDWERAQRVGVLRRLRRRLRRGRGRS